MSDVKELVQKKYGEAARRVGHGGSACCGSAPSSDGCGDPITSNLYDASQMGSIPEEAALASLGCGNPTALADLLDQPVATDDAGLAERIGVAVFCVPGAESALKITRPADLLLAEALLRGLES